MAKYKGPTPGDLLVHEESAIVCREGIQVTNPSANEFRALVGTPIDASGNVIVATGEGSTAGLLLEEVVIAGSGTTVLQVGYLARGPAAINEDKILTVDPNGAGYNVANIVTALAALGIVARQEPTKRSIQTN